MRINARLDPDHYQKLDFLVQSTDSNVSEVVKQAIDVYYEQVRSARPSPAEILEDTGFVGAARADPELSSTYTERLTSSLAAKHGSATAARRF